MQSKKNIPHRIFIIRSDRWGEFLLSLPAVKMVKENFPQSTIYLLALKENIELVKDVDFIDRFIEYKEQEFKGFRGSVNLTKLLCKEKIDCLIALNPKKEFHLASFLAGVKFRVGYNRKWGFCLNYKIEDKKYLAEKHEIEYNIELVSLICVKKFIPQVRLKGASLEILKRKIPLNFNKRYIVFHPFSSDHRKMYPSALWASLIDKINSLYKEEVVIIGGEQEKQLLTSATSALKGLKYIDLVGRLSLKELISFFKEMCKLLITTDSGPMHLASFLNIPTIALFGPSNVKRWSPLSAKRIILKKQNLYEITPQEIISCLVELLK